LAKKLIITEKPSVAMEFAKVLNVNGTKKNGYIESNEWIITWCYGHLVTMSYPEKYDESLKFWRLDTLPFIPTDWKYEVIPSVQNQFNIVSQLLQRDDVEEIYNAGDSGREGEYIQRLVFMMSNPNPNAKMKRVWIDSQTEDEIKRGIREAKDLNEYNSLSDAAYLRAKEDYLIGINFSRLLSIIFGKRIAKNIDEDKVSISVGRVMTCVLGMIVSREREINNFVKTKYYKIVGLFGENGEVKTEWKVDEKSSVFESPKLYNETGFKKEDDAKSFIAQLAGKEAVVEEVKKSKIKENPPLLYNLAEIQNDAGKIFKLKPAEVLDIIQELYEKKMVTYPRTDARVLSSAVAKEIGKNLNGLYKSFKDEEVSGYIKKMIEEKYPIDKLEKTKYVDDSKITDHYAIIPTGQGLENYDKLSDTKKGIYKLIVKRFISIFYPPAEFNKVNLSIRVDNKELFTASGKVCVKSGYQEITKSKNNEEKKDDTNLEILTKLKKNDKITISNYEIKEGETTPPARYSASNIVLAMENAGKLIEDEALREQIKGAGIGTSATRGEIIAKLERIKYIDINSKTNIITPTTKGEAIYDVVFNSMPDMLNPKLTASWEKGLDMVAKKEIEAQVFMDKLENYIKSKINKLVIKR